MNATAKLTGYRQAPRKVRLIANLVKGKSIDVALVELDHRAKRAAPVFAKLIKSAVANAKAAGLDEKSLKVSSIRVDKGPIMKRSMPRAQGRAFPIHKHTSHIVVTLSDGSSDAKNEKKAEVKTEKKVKVEKKAPAKKTAAKK